MGRFHYHVQAEHYNEGRRQIARLLKSGKIFGSHNPEFLAKVAAVESWASVFVFLKKAEAPLTWACSLTLPAEGENPLLTLARQSIDKACQNYAVYQAEFGLDTPWMTQEPVMEMDVSDLPPWFRTL